MRSNTYELINISKYYDSIEVLRDISLTLTAGTITIVLGPSGCGKTTLLNIMAGLIVPDKGSRPGFASARFSYAFQESRLLPWMSAEANLSFALKGAIQAAVLDEAEAEKRSREFMEAAGLASCAGRLPGMLSGGMRQRLSLARAFAYPADVLLLDEAFQSVDLRTKIDLMDSFLALWKRERPTVIAVTHDIEEAVYLADRIVVLSGKPAQIIDDFEIAEAHQNRRLGSDSSAEASARLYRITLDGAARQS